MSVPRKWSNTFKVGMWTCTMEYTEGRDIAAQWDPHLPEKFDRPHPELLRAYRNGRDALLEQVAADLGYKILIFET